MKKNNSHNSTDRLKQNKVYTLINIGGVVTGIVISFLIGLLIWDETTANNSYKKHSVIVKGIKCSALNDGGEVENIMTIPASEELRISFGSSFQLVVLASHNDNQLFSTGTKKIRYKVTNPELADN